MTHRRPKPEEASSFRLSTLAALALALVSPFVAPGSAAAGPWFKVWAGDIGVPPNAQMEGPAAPVEIDGSANTPYGWFSWDSNSYEGLVRTRMSNAKYTDLFASGRRTHASYRFDDFVITDGTGVPKSVNFHVVLHVAGLVGSETGGGTSQTGAQATGMLRVRGVSNQWNPDGGKFTSSGASTGVFTGMSDLDFQGTFQFGPFSTTTESPQVFEVIAELTIAVGVSWPGGNWIRADGDFLATMPTSSPVILLPEGFVANSSQGAIVNNWFYPGLAATPDNEADDRAATRLLPNAPNPFSGSTTIAFQLAKAGPVELTIHDVAGRLVARLESGYRDPGRHAVTWDGRDTRGLPASAGLYFYRLTHSGGVDTRRLVLAR